MSSCQEPWCSPGLAWFIFSFLLLFTVHLFITYLCNYWIDPGLVLGLVLLYRPSFISFFLPQLNSRWRHFSTTTTTTTTFILLQNKNLIPLGEVSSFV